METAKALQLVLSPSGDTIDRITFKMTSEGYQLLADRLPQGTKIACEAMGMTYPFFRAMHEQHGFDVTVANPKVLAWIVKSKKKSDKIDSLKLKLHQVGMLSEAHLLTREELLARDLLIQRVRLGEDARKVKLRISESSQARRREREASKDERQFLGDEKESHAFPFIRR